MLCIHGKEVKVIIESYDPYCWDDGWKEYNEKGERESSGGYLLVEGCDECLVIDSSVRKGW
jgi:hypothetical protein